MTKKAVKKKVEASEVEKKSLMEILNGIDSKKKVEKVTIGDVEEIYKTICDLRDSLETSIEHLSQVEDCKKLADAAFKAGRSYHELVNASRIVDDLVDKMIDKYDFSYYNL